jgi:hypothetical protein
MSVSQGSETEAKLGKRGDVCEKWTCVLTETDIIQVHGTLVCMSTSWPPGNVLDGQDM